jgi:outer membrane cobalamin receptor
VAARLTGSACLAGYALYACALARAQEPARDAAEEHDYGATALVLRPLPATNREDPTAAGTETDARAQLAANASVSDALLQVPGARPLRTGATGSFSSASLRGAELEHTSVLFGEVPLSSADALAFDLSSVPLGLLERVAVYRGGAPAWLSQGAIGGVVQLVPRSAHGQELSATATAGSLGTYGLGFESALVPASGNGPRVLGAVSMLGTSGDLAYRFDNKTALDPSDDYDTRRKNADLVQGNGLLHVRQPAGPGAFEVVLLGFERAGGEPGAPADPAFRARRTLNRGLLGVSYTLEKKNDAGERALRLQALAAGSFERSRFSDLFAEVNPEGATLSDDLSLRGLGRLAGSVALTDFLELTAIGSAQREARMPRDELRRLPVPDSGRTSLAGTTEANVHGALGSHRVELRPSLRLEHDGTHLYSETFGTLGTLRAQTTLATYRVGLAVGLLTDLTFAASAASGARAPSMLELFGDGALILGNLSLRPEHSRSFDAGLVDVTCAGDVALSAELRGFLLDIDDEVVFVRNSFSQLVPRNLAKSRIRGAEAGARASFGSHVFVNGAATVMATEGKPGKQLPNRPPLLTFLEPGVAFSDLGPLDALRLFVDSTFVAASYDDPDNGTLPKPSQLFFGAGTVLAFLDRHAELRVTVNDVFDRGGQDLRHFPLPGRTVMTSLTYKEEKP